MTDDWNSDSTLPPHAERPGRQPLSASERRQRNVIVGLSIGAVIVLIAGMIAFVATREDDPDTTVQETVVATTLNGTTPSSTSTTSTTTTTTTMVDTTLPSTTVPIVANADGGDDLMVSQGAEFTLSASDLAEGTPNAAVRWTQTAGPDATAGVGSLRGADAVAIAPAEVATLVFMLEVAGTDGVATDEVSVRVFEDAGRATFVDGERGDDSGADGSMEAPFRSIGAAAASANGNDLYVRSVGSYDESGATIALDAQMSLYGGFDENWNRDPDQRVVIAGASPGVSVSGDGERVIASIELTSADSSAGGSIGLAISAVPDVVVQDSRIVAGAAAAGGSQQAGGLSIGVAADDLDQLTIERSTVNGGTGGAGGDGGPIPEPPVNAAGGGDATGRTGGAGGGELAGSASGDGGQGGETSDGARGRNNGGAGGTAGSVNGQPGPGGSGGRGGDGGVGGVGLVSDEGAETVPVGRTGEPGMDGQQGATGGGGGGGFGPLLVAGGGGGGAGGGGLGGPGAAPGHGGGGSMGLQAVGVDRIVISESLIAGGRGGDGGDGAVGGFGGQGGIGGDGANGVDGVFADGGNGGGGGGGGGGGRGGHGGGGAGGPSYGLLTTRVGEIFVDSSRIRGGAGGAGAAGGFNGVDGGDGLDGTTVSGGGAKGTDEPGTNGRAAGAAGGSSYGWFDDSGAAQSLSDASFEEGTAGPGGEGDVPGDDGAVITSNV